MHLFSNLFGSYWFDFRKLCMFIVYFVYFLENGKRSRSGELAPISPRKKKDPLTPVHENIYREKRPSRPLSPNQQMTVMLAIEHEEDKVIGKPSEVDMEVWDGICEE